MERKLCLCCLSIRKTILLFLLCLVLFGQVASSLITWKNLTECSKSCGTGEQVRQGCGELSFFETGCKNYTMSCNKHDCPIASSKAYYLKTLDGPQFVISDKRNQAMCSTKKTILPILQFYRDRGIVYVGSKSSSSSESFKPTRSTTSPAVVRFTSTKRRGYGLVCKGGKLIVQKGGGQSFVASKYICLPNPCHNGGLCKIRFNSKHCTCSEGFAGSYCKTALDPCRQNPCKSGICRRSGNSYKCDCHGGYTGQHCHIAYNPCWENNCLNGGYCEQTDDGQSYWCKCNGGFSGQYCENKDPCQPNPCLNGGICRPPSVWDFSLSPRCDCLASFVGEFCQTVLDPCQQTYCGNGQCVNSGSSYRCICDFGFTGEFCDIEPDPCQPNPCNHGDCIKSGNYFQCKCWSGYAGQYCNTVESDVCQPNPCINGDCMRNGDFYICICRAGYTGQRCDQEHYICWPNPCHNGGTCAKVDEQNFICICSDYYTGTFCETLIPSGSREFDPCSPNQCYNGGVCERNGQTFICRCLTGYSGRLCDILMSNLKTEFDPCSPNQCYNGGVCERNGQTFICRCLSGYSGRLCDIPMNNLQTGITSACTPNPCLHGECKETNAGYKCYCSVGYHGDTCRLSLYPGQWTACSKTCGGGTRYRSELCERGNVVDCPRVYEDCNMHNCPTSTCPWNSEHRFESSSECCSKTSVHNCSNSDDNVFTHLIIGGVKSKPKDWPWMAAIYLQTEGKFVCGGSIVDKSWILTAAHCVINEIASNILILAGSHHRTQLDFGHRWIVASRVILHPNYDGIVNDVALIKLQYQLTYSDNIKPICLPNGEQVDIDVQCFAPGWGIAYKEDIPKEKSSTSLRHAALRILPLDVCVQGYKGHKYFRAVTDKIICSGLLSGDKDTCLGDSGGPLVCQRSTSCDWFLAGVTSFGATECGSKNLPSGYVNIVHYEAWIKQTMKAN